MALLESLFYTKRPYPLLWVKFAEKFLMGPHCLKQRTGPVRDHVSFKYPYPLLWVQLMSGPLTGPHVFVEIKTDAKEMERRRT